MPQYELLLAQPANFMEGKPIAAGSVTGPEQVSDYPSPLPEGYSYAGTGTIRPAELAKLYNTVSIGRNATEQSVVDHFKRYQEEGIDYIEVGVRDKTDRRLVGYGALWYSDGVGILDDLAVNPLDQHKGIGKFIIDQRLTQADALGLAELYSSIEPTNTLKTYYGARGFQHRENGAWVRESRP